MQRNLCKLLCLYVVHMYLCVHMYIYVCGDMHVWMCRAWFLYMCVRLFVRYAMCRCVCVYVCTCICINTHIAIHNDLPDLSMFWKLHHACVVCCITNQATKIKMGTNHSPELVVNWDQVASSHQQHRHFAYWTWIQLTKKYTCKTTHCDLGKTKTETGTWATRNTWNEAETEMLGDTYWEKSLDMERQRRVKTKEYAVHNSKCTFVSLIYT